MVAIQFPKPHTNMSEILVQLMSDSTQFQSIYQKTVHKAKLIISPLYTISSHVLLFKVQN